MQDGRGDLAGQVTTTRRPDHRSQFPPRQASCRPGSTVAAALSLVGGTERTLGFPAEVAITGGPLGRPSPRGGAPVGRRSASNFPPGESSAEAVGTPPESASVAPGPEARPSSGAAPEAAARDDADLASSEASYGASFDLAGSPLSGADGTEVHVREGYRASGAADARPLTRQASRKRLKYGLASVIVFVAATALLVSPAAAAVTRSYEGVSFGPGGIGAGEFAALQSVAVDPASGDVFVLDAAEGGELYKFSATGAPLIFTSTGTNIAEKGVGSAGVAETEIAVAPPGSPGGTAGDIYVAAYGTGVTILSPAGEKIGQLAGSGYCGVAVNPNGHVFVGDYNGGAGGDSSIVEFTPRSQPLQGSDQSGGSTAPLEHICNVAVNSDDDIYSAEYFQKGGNLNGELNLLEGLSDPSPTPIQSGTVALTVDPTTGGLNVDEASAVTIRTPSGKEDGRYGEEVEPSNGVAVSPDGSQAYLANGTSQRVQIFGTPKVLPSVEIGPATGMTETTARLEGTVNPDGGPAAACRFEIVTKKQFQSNGFGSASLVACEPSTQLTGSEDIPVRADAVGLTHATAYVVRLVAESANGKNVSDLEPFETPPTPFLSPSLSPCPSNEQFRVDLGSFLPDCRAYEQASPANKKGAGVETLQPFLLASESGDAATFYTAAGNSPASGEAGNQEFSINLARKNGDGWETSRLLPPSDLADTAKYLGSTSDLGFALVEASKFEQGGIYAALLLLDTRSTDVQQITPFLGKAAGFKTRDNFALDGITGGGSRVFFETDGAVPTQGPQPVPGRDNLYMWDSASHAVTLVGVLPGSGGQAPSEGSFGGPLSWFQGVEPAEGGAMASYAVSSAHAISTNGGIAYFTAAGTGQLYVRRGLATPTPTTLRISKPGAGVEDPYVELEGLEGKVPALFQEATPTGNAAFLLSGQKLTNDASTGPEDGGRDLYRWDSASESLIDLTPDPSQEAENGARVQGVLGVSADGSSGYFIARGVLKAGASNGELNLYRFADDAGQINLTYIATIGEDLLDRYNFLPLASAGFPESKSSRIDPSANALLFSSTRSLTGYENQNASGIECPTGKCAELYLYSAGTKELHCVSCDPSGSQPTGAATLQSLGDAFLNPSPPWPVSLSRNLTNTGTRVFFQTPDRLVARDENGLGGCPPKDLTGRGPGRCQDVYEWEAPGTGSCVHAEANGGCLYLMSSGQSTNASFFVDASSDGSSAFITTQSSLVPSDKDELSDLYDVREEGGLASQFIGPPTQCTTPDACHNAPLQAPPAVTSATESFHGPGNQKPKKCKKGLVRKGDRCVRRHHRLHRNHRRKRRNTKHARPQRSAIRRAGGAK